MKTDDPERAFAPLVEQAAGERYRPMGARWFLERSILAVAEDRGCADRPIAVGHQLPELQTNVNDWIYPSGLGLGAAYYRNALDVHCELESSEPFYANQLTRPNDPGVSRAVTARPEVGFYVDLEDSAREGPPSSDRTPVYVERREEGDNRVRLTYWMLYGMHAPVGAAGAPAHEGDWERVDVLLDEVDDAYRPQAVQLGLDAGEIDPGAIDEVAWSAVERVDGTHPRLFAERGSHRLSSRPPARGCTECVPWRTWEGLRDARQQLWYGFGGAWGEVGATSATTGPLGPHGIWAPDEDALYSNVRPISLP